MKPPQLTKQHEQRLQCQANVELCSYEAALCCQMQVVQKYSIFGRQSASIHENLAEMMALKVVPNN